MSGLWHGGVGAVTICDNCKGNNKVKSYPIGPPLGSQRDPYWKRVHVCAECKIALESRDFKSLGNRYREFKIDNP